MRTILAAALLLAATQVLAAELLDTTRTGAFEYQAQYADGTTSNHQSRLAAGFACANWKALNPGRDCFVQGGRWRITLNLPAVPPVDPPPPLPAAVDCVVSAWTETPGAWSACSSGQQTRTVVLGRTITTQPANGGAACSALVDSRVETRTCTVTPPTTGSAPFDMSGYDIPFPVTWPAAPVTSRTVAVDTCSEFQAAVQQSNVRITVAPGTYNCSVSIAGDDQDIVMSNSATLNGSVSIDTSGGTDRKERIRWTGGNIVHNSSQMTWRAVSDLLLNDVHISGSVILHRDTRLGVCFDRVAIINSTIDGRAGNFPFPLQSGYDGSGSDCTDTIIANGLFLGNSNSSIRLQGQLRTVVVESYFRGMSNSGSLLTAFRIGEGSNLFFEGGTESKPNVSVGRYKIDYTELSGDSWAVTNVTINGSHRYNTNDGGGAAFLHGSMRNTGTVSNLRTSMPTGVGGNPPGISPFTTGSGVSSVQWWDGVTMPSPAAYGAMR